MFSRCQRCRRLFKPTDKTNKTCHRCACRCDQCGERIAWLHKGVRTGDLPLDWLMQARKFNRPS